MEWRLNHVGQMAQSVQDYSNLVRLRKTLARFGLEQRIETVRGQGYRMKG